MDIIPNWGNLKEGQYITFVAGSILLNNGNAHLMYTMDFPRRQVVVHGDLGKVEHQYAFLQVRVDQVHPTVICKIDPHSTVLPLGPCHRDDLILLTELCCGMGAWSSMGKQTGFHVLAGVDANQRWQQLFEATHPEGAKFIAGDCASPSVVAQLHSLGAVHSIILGGVNCQPFSSGGDRKGLDDPRSSSLHKVLQTAWALQSPAIVLECVADVLKDPRFQEILAKFCASTGFSITQQTLELADTWCTFRHRWFAVLTASPIGKCFIPPLPPNVAWKTIGKVMPDWQDWPEDQQEQIQLNLYELDKFHRYVKGGIERCYVDDAKTLPTCLHSAGNQLYPCKCGCRGPLSMERLKDRGLFGVLVPLKDSVYHEGINMKHARYLHPAEMYLLNGGDPTLNFGSDMRLALAAIGQCVAPIQAIWVLGHLKATFETFMTMPCNNPLETMTRHIHEILLARDSMWTIEKAVPASIPLDDTMMKFAIPDDATNTSVRFSAASSTTVAEFCQAQKQLHGSPLDLGLPNAMLLKECTFDNPSTVVHVDIPIDGDTALDADESDQTSTALVGLNMPALLEIVCPSVVEESQCMELRKKTISKESRQAILAQQTQVWADDEVLWHLLQIQTNSALEQRVCVWDPLLVSSAIRFGRMEGLKALASIVTTDLTIITAMIVDKHWFPMVWRRNCGELLTYTCGLPFHYSMAHQAVITCVAEAMNIPAQPLNNRKVNFLIPNACGALTIAFIRHLIWAEDLPHTFDELQVSHQKFRSAFETALCDPTPRPWTWGAGDQVTTKLGIMLQEHGVAESDVSDRIKMILGKIGQAQVNEALQKQQPWKELKWLANQQVPVVQLIRPSELQSVITKKAQSGQPIGRKAQKQKTKANNSTPKALDPAVLRLEAGVFVCGPDQTPLGQLAINQVGPNANGIILCNSDAAVPYLKGGKQISTGGLAMIVLDAGDDPLPTQLIAEHVKLPLICTINAEPVLAKGQMYQLGALPVTKSKKADQFDLVTVSTCVAKFAIFRDETKEEWSQVVAHPLRHLFKYVPPLVACIDPECDGSCENWHVNPTFQIAEPILEVWGRQWLSLQFVPIEASKADTYMVHIRYPSCLQHQLQGYSGENGIYLEPKGLDGRTPSDAFTVCWLPRACHSDVTLLKQTVQHVVGVARMGLKYGVRCQACHAEQVHMEVKPTSSFLPPGKKQVFLIGPMPYGTVKSSIVAAVEGIGWKARPIQPTATTVGAEGVMWKIQSVQPPPKSIISTSWGDIVVTRLADQQIHTKPPMNVVGATRTVQLCSTGASDKKIADPLQQHDPWANFRPTQGPSAERGSLPDPVDALEKRIVSRVMAKLPESSMEIDTEAAGASQSKLQELEKHIEELRAGHCQLHQIVSEQGQSQGRQIQQLAAQTANIEHAVTDQAGKLTQFQGQFRAQIEHQQTQLDSLFQQQMAKLEELISKKQRTE